MVIIPTPLGEGICKTMYIELSSILRGKLTFGYDEAKELMYADIDVDPEFIGQAIIELAKKYSEHIKTLTQIPVVPWSAPGTDGYVMRKNLGISLRKPYRESLYNSLIQFLKSKPSNTGIELDIANAKISIIKNTLGIMLGGNTPAPLIIKSEVFYELGRFSGFRDLTPRGRPRKGLIALSLGPSAYASLMLMSLAYEVASEPPYHLFMTIDYPLAKEIVPDLANVLISLRNDIVEYVKRLGIGVYAEDFDSLRLSLLYKAYYLVKRHYLGIKGLTDSIYVFHLVMSSGRRFIKILEYTIDLNSINVIDNGFNVLGIKGDEALRVARALSDVLLALIRASKITGVVQALPAIDRVKTYVRNLALAIIDANIPSILDNAYIIARTLVERDFRNILCSQLRNIVNANIDSTMASRKLSLEETLKMIMEEEDIVARSREEFVQEVVAERLNRFTRILELIAK